LSKRVILTDQVMRPIAHFSHAVRVGGTLHLGATAGTDAHRRLAGVTPGMIDVEAQVVQMFVNARTVLKLLDADLDHVIRVKTYLTDMRDLPRYEAQFSKVFGDLKPNHVIVGSAGFPLPQAAVELDLVAEVGTPVSRFAAAGDAAAVGSRFYCSAGPLAAAESGGRQMPDTFHEQVDATFDQLLARLAVGGKVPSDAVYLHGTLREARFAEAFRAAFNACFPIRPPACTVVIAPLADVDCMLQVEAIAVAGGGLAVEDPSGDEGVRFGSPAMWAGDELYIGAQLGVGSDGSVARGVEAQTRFAWERIKSLLGAAGMRVEDVLRTNNVLTDWRHYTAFNAGYGANVGEPYPPRATVLGGLTVCDALVQIEAIAHRQGHGALIVQAA